MQKLKHTQAPADLDLREGLFNKKPRAVADRFDDDLIERCLTLDPKDAVTFFFEAFEYESLDTTELDGG